MKQKRSLETIKKYFIESQNESIKELNIGKIEVKKPFELTDRLSQDCSLIKILNLKMQRLNLKDKQLLFLVDWQRLYASQESQLNYAQILN